MSETPVDPPVTCTTCGKVAAHLRGSTSSEFLRMSSDAFCQGHASAAGREREACGRIERLRAMTDVDALHDLARGLRLFATHYDGEDEAEALYRAGLCERVADRLSRLAPERGGEEETKHG
jgi:hypothetical protein